MNVKDSPPEKFKKFQEKHHNNLFRIFSEQHGCIHVFFIVVVVIDDNDDYDDDDDDDNVVVKLIIIFF